MFRITGHGDWERTRKWLLKLQSGHHIFRDLDKYGQMGVNALRRATPIDTGLASISWEYRIIRGRDRIGIEWYNTDIENGVSVVILVQYGHATRNGSYIQGRDFINPAMRPVFDEIEQDIWEKVRAS